MTRSPQAVLASPTLDSQYPESPPQGEWVTVQTDHWRSSGQYLRDARGHGWLVTRAGRRSVHRPGTPLLNWTAARADPQIGAVSAAHRLTLVRGGTHPAAPLLVLVDVFEGDVWVHSESHPTAWPTRPHFNIQLTGTSSPFQPVELALLHCFEHHRERFHTLIGTADLDERDRLLSQALHDLNCAQDPLYPTPTDEDAGDDLLDELTRGLRERFTHGVDRLGEYALVPLSGARGEGKFMMIDPDRLEWHLSDGRSWSLNKDGVPHNASRESVCYHKVVNAAAEHAYHQRTGRTPMTYHLNGNCLDNRRANLEVTFRGDRQGVSPRQRTPGKYLGVEQVKGGFRAIHTYQGVKTRLGHFKTAKEAARAYDRQVLRVLGAAGNTNFPKKDYAAEFPELKLK